MSRFISPNWYSGDSAMSEVVIGECRKNARENYRLTLREARDGEPQLDLRVYQQNGTGGMRKTAAGLPVRPDNISELKALFEAGEDVLAQLGLLPKKGGRS